MKILICNRGEIAIRVANAVRELGHIAVGLWTDSEPDAFHLTFCDEWIKLEGSNNTETYLNIEQILELIKSHNIQAVHPGYGFLSENYNFVKELEMMGVIFIGPNAKAIQLMGDKAVSKQIAKDAGVPVIPGSVGEVESDTEAIELAKQIGYPILLKAVAGGGGKGMRTCNDEAELIKNFSAVKREAQSSFGNPGILVEKFILNPRHIEVQILADKNNNVFHLFERECSIQRRHQKIIEESPSPFIGDDKKLRKEICEVAVKLAKKVKYDSAGTVEFVMGEDKSFYFLEMNTRVQVEHPITEEVTKVDIVRNMIKSALEVPLDVQKQEDIHQQGHSIECRICCEDPIDMKPAPGKVNGFHYEMLPGMRFDHCIYNGFEVKPDFDPMIGKLIITGFNRKVSLEKMRKALDELFINGIKTNIDLHKVILKEENFISGKYSTNYINTVSPQNSVRMYSVEDLMLLSLATELR